MRLRFLGFVFFASLFSLSAQAVEDIYAEKRQAVVQSLQKLQEDRPELKKSLAGIGYLEQGLRIQAYFSGEAAHEAYDLPLPDEIFKSMDHALKAYKQEQPLESQEIKPAKSQTLFKLKQEPVFGGASSNTETKDIMRSKSPPSKRPEEPAGPISRNQSFGLHSAQEKFSPPTENLSSFGMGHLGSEKDDEKRSSVSPKQPRDQKSHFSLVKKILDLRGKKGKRESVSPLFPLTGFPDLERTSEEEAPILAAKKSPLPKRSETPGRTLSRQSSAGPKEEKKGFVNRETQLFVFVPIDVTQRENKQGGSFLLGLKPRKPPATLKEFFNDYFQAVAEKKIEGTQSDSYFESPNSGEEFEKAAAQTLFSEAYKPLILPVAGEETLSPLVFALGTLNQIFFARFSDQPVYIHGEKVNPVAQSRFDCFLAWELIEQLNGFQQSESKKISFFSDVPTPLEEMKQNMKPVFDLSTKINSLILDLAEKAQPETLEKIGAALYIALYDCFPYVLSLEDFKDPRELIGYLERLSQHYLATSYFFNPESVRERFEFQGIRQRQAVVEVVNHTAKRFKKPPFSHEIGRFETTQFLEQYVSDLRQEAEAWVTSGFKSLAQAFK